MLLLLLQCYQDASLRLVYSAPCLPFSHAQYVPVAGPRLCPVKGERWTDLWPPPLRSHRSLFEPNEGPTPTSPRCWKLFTVLDGNCLRVGRVQPTADFPRIHPSIFAPPHPTPPLCVLQSSFLAHGVLSLSVQSSWAPSMPAFPETRVQLSRRFKDVNTDVHVTEH